MKKSGVISEGCLQCQIVLARRILDKLAKKVVSRHCSHPGICGAFQELILEIRELDIPNPNNGIVEDVARNMFKVLVEGFMGRYPGHPGIQDAFKELLREIARSGIDLRVEEM